MTADQKVLIVEDDEGVGLHLAFIVKKLGYTPLEVITHAETAIEKIDELKPSIILMDISLAGKMNGIEAAQIIRERDHVPVIFLSGMSSETILQEAKQSGPYGYLVKPVDPKELHAAIELSLYKHQLEHRMLESEQRYRLVFERMTDSFSIYQIITDEAGQPVDFVFLVANSACCAILGKPAEALIGRSAGEVIPNFNEYLKEKACQVVRTGEPLEFNYYEQEFDRYFDIKIYLALPGQVASITSDISERMRAEKTLEESELRFRQLAEGVREVFWLRSGTGSQILYVSPTYERVWGRPCEELLANPLSFIDSVYPADRERILRAQREHNERQVPFNEEYRIIRPDGSVRWVWARTFPVYDKDGQIIRHSGIAEDITERKRSEQQLISSVQLAEKRALRMSVLRSIDQAITTFTDLPDMTRSVLNSIIRLAEVGAGMIFRHQETAPDGSRQFALYGDAGIDPRKIRQPAMEWMQSLVVDVFDTCKPVFINRLDTQASLGAVQFILDFGFGGICVLPLIAKGQKKGILLLMTRFSDSLDQDLIEYFESLALQTAIAIDNVEMFTGLKRSNMQLSEAYDATIRGWAQALELRDKETRGHSERVIWLATRLAIKLGIQEDELVHFQRGVLLHDIGKMAIPDNILLKPGPLTEDEWVLMRQHPVYAYEMLSGIDYLKPALDVPYSHHEKWDGTGYPLGMKGEAIPRVARIFTIVDTWDALTSGRPYHPPWSREDALAYIARQAGKQFDPSMVGVFLRLMEEEREKA